MKKVKLKFIKKNTPLLAGGSLAHADFQGELRFSAPLESLSARVSRAGKIRTGHKNKRRLAAGIFIAFLSIASIGFARDGGGGHGGDHGGHSSNGGDSSASHGGQSNKSNTSDSSGGSGGQPLYIRHHHNKKED